MSHPEQLELGWICGSRGQEEKFKPRNAHARYLSYTLLFGAWREFTLGAINTCYSLSLLHFLLFARACVGSAGTDWHSIKILKAVVSSQEHKLAFDVSQLFLSKGKKTILTQFTPLPQSQECPFDAQVLISFNFPVVVDRLPWLLRSVFPTLAASVIERLWYSDCTRFVQDPSMLELTEGWTEFAPFRSNSSNSMDPSVLAAKSKGCARLQVGRCSLIRCQSRASHHALKRCAHVCRLVYERASRI